MFSKKLPPHACWLVPIATIGLAAILAPAPSAIQPNTDEVAGFELPAEVTPRNYETKLAKLDERNLWGNVRSLSEPQVLTDPKWWLSGTGGVDKERFVIMEREGSQPEFLKVGDNLPGKAKILEIQQDALCILIEGKKRKLPVLSK